MKWTSHKLLTGSIVFAMTGSILPSLAAIVGSIIPDSVEGFPDDSNRAAWRKRHRKLSHWPILYALITAALIGYAHYYGVHDLLFANLPNIIFSPIQNLSQIIYAVSFIFLGALLHIIEDAFCGKVPLLDPYKQTIGIKLFYVGSAKEYAYVFALSALLVYARFHIAHIPIV